MSPLTIYKASAGSGKTYTLSRDFISLVITDPELYKHILAVTFTNKATDEMKNRILDELHKLSAGKPSPMMEFIATENALTETEVSGRAEIILETILHNYSRFHIETIDRFFQRAIRAFTKEIGLSGGYQIEIDSERVLSESVDEMLDSLDEEPGLLEWFVEFARDKVQEGKNWNLKKCVCKSKIYSSWPRLPAWNRLHGWLLAQKNWDLSTCRSTMPNFWSLPNRRIQILCLPARRQRIVGGIK